MEHPEPIPLFDGTTFDDIRRRVTKVRGTRADGPETGPGRQEGAA